MQLLKHEHEECIVKYPVCFSVMWKCL